MAQPVLLLSAAVEAGGQSSVGPANYLLSEAAALRLGCRDCQRAILTNGRCSMPSGLLHRLSVHRFWPLWPQLQRSSSERSAPTRWHVQLGTRACEAPRGNVMPVNACYGHHWAVVNCLKRWEALRLHVGLAWSCVGVFWHHKAPWKVGLRCCIALGHQLQRLICASLCRPRRPHRR